MNSGTGKAAATVASAAGTSRNNHVFAAAASGRGASGVAAATLRYSRQETRSQARTEGAPRAEGAPAETAARPWEQQSGPYLTTDGGHLDAAEKAFGAGMTHDAGQHLERAFGNRDVAAQVLGLYQREGHDGARRVRAIVDATQSAAAGMTRHTMQDEQGQATPDFTARVQRELTTRHIATGQPEEAALVSQIAGATVRTPVGIWQDPQGERKLAHAILAPQSAEIAPGDLSAHYQLQQLAHQHGWEAAQMESLFGATRTAAQAGQAHPSTVEAQLAQEPIWQQSAAPLRAEASRLALLVAADAQVQRGISMELPIESPVTAPPVAAPHVFETPVAPPAAGTPERNP